MIEAMPIWCRLPKAQKDADGEIIAPARCPWTGLSAAKLFLLCVPCERNKWKPPVRSVSLTEDGTPLKRKRTKGGGKPVRMYHLPSLLEYLDRLADKQASEIEALSEERSAA